MTYRHNPNEGQICTKYHWPVRQPDRAERRVDNADTAGRTIMTGHDNEGNEVEIHFFEEEEDEE